MTERKQPDALARLEAWLAEDGDRYVSQINWRGCVASVGGFRVELGNRATGGVATAYEFGVLTKFATVVYAKSPGLAATIEAALEQAGEVGL